MLSSRDYGRASACLLLGFLSWAGAGCGPEIPKALEYSEGEFSLKVSGAFRALTRTAASVSARPPAEETEPAPSTVLISQGDYQSIWPALQALAGSEALHPPDVDFMAAPPDTLISESLRLIVEGKVLADWSREHARLKSPARDPIERVAERLRRVHEARRTDPVIPDRLVLEVARRDGGAVESRDLRKTGSAITLSTSPAADAGAPRREKPVSAEAFARLWREPLQRAVLSVSYAPLGPSGPSRGGDWRWRLKATVEGVTVTDSTFSAPFAGQEAFDALWRAVAALDGEGAGPRSSRP